MDRKRRLSAGTPDVYGTKKRKVQEEDVKPTAGSTSQIPTSHVFRTGHCCSQEVL
jgi:hypothetical protein